MMVKSLIRNTFIQSGGTVKADHDLSDIWRFNKVFLYCFLRYKSNVVHFHLISEEHLS